MVGRKASLALLAAVVLLYGVSPYVALYRLAAAVRGGDTRALAAWVDWDAVRGGLKQDIAEGVMGDLAETPDQPRMQLAMNKRAISGDTATPVQGDTLPPFGASFISGVAGSMIDREVTAEHLGDLLRDRAPDPRTSSLSWASIRAAFFAGPTSFELSVLCPGQEAADQPLRVRLELRATGWTLVRAWVPQDLVDLANART